MPDLYECVYQWVKKGKHVVCAGLDANAQLKLFGMTYSLLPIADEFVKLTAICSVCVADSFDNRSRLKHLAMYPASFTDKFGGDPSKEIEIGAGDIYRSVCRLHHSVWNRSSSNH
jgi:thymidine kinase